MKLIKNSGNERVVDELKKCLVELSSLDIASSGFSLFAFGELCDLLSKKDKCRLVFLRAESGDLALVGSIHDRPFRNRLQTRWLAQQCLNWIEKKTEIKRVPGFILQATQIAESLKPKIHRAIAGSCAFTTEGLCG